MAWLCPRLPPLHGPLQQVGSGRLDDMCFFDGRDDDSISLFVCFGGEGFLVARSLEGLVVGGEGLLFMARC